MGGPDGVSVEAAKWAGALGRLGFDVLTVAGEGIADRIVPGLGIDPTGDTADADLASAVDRAVDDADVVVVENLCSLPLNPRATTAVARAIAGRPAILHHHDLPWQRERFADVVGIPPTDPAWAHVTINDLSREQLGSRGITARTIRNAFDVEVPVGDRAKVRGALGLGHAELLVAQPTRAIARKNIPAAVGLARELGAVFWLWGPAEEGYGPTLAQVLAEAGVPVRQGLPPDCRVGDGYAAADVIAFPSTWEGFGNPTIESAVHRRPLAVAAPLYPALEEISRLGFRWFDASDPAPLQAWLAAPDASLLDHNQALARRHFSLTRLDRDLRALLEDREWLP